MDRIIIVNAYTNGHHPFYLSLIIKSLVSFSSVTVLGELTENICNYLSRHTIAPSSVKWVKPNGSSVADFYVQSLSVAREESASAVFYTYFDSFLEHVLSEKSPIDHEVTGIWLHPHALDRKYRWIPGIDKRIRYRKQIHSKLGTHRSTTNIQKIFFLDPDAPNRLAKLNKAITGIVLPDPGESTPVMDKATARKYFQLPGEEKTIFLHIGTSEKRKGLSDTIKAFYLGLSNSQFRERAFLLRVGINDKLSPRDRTKLLKLVKSGHASLMEEFVSESDFIEYFSAADVVLLPYRKFRFSSGILVNALNAGRPALASDYGMIGETVKKSAAGNCFKEGSVASLSKAMVDQCRAAPATTPRIDTFKEQSKFMNLIAQSFQELQMPCNSNCGEK